MGVQSKITKLQAKCKALKEKVSESILARREEHSEFISKILDRCLEEEKVLQSLLENKKGRKDEQAEIKPKDTKVEETAWNPFTDIPEEVVEMIVERLGSSRDLVSLSKTCKLFQRILEPTKTTWLFHTVLPHIANEHSLQPMDVVNFRWVCKKWQVTVDELIENASLPHDDLSISFKSELQQACISSLFGSEFYPAFGTRDMERFLNEMQHHSGNPFVGRKWSLITGMAVPEDFGRANDEVPIMSFYKKAIQFLERFGKHLWTLNMFVRLLTLMDHFQVIRSCLENTRNVKTLSIAGFCYLVTRSSKEECAEVDQDLLDNPFPALPNLVSLELLECHSLFHKHMLPSYSNQLHTLRVSITYNTVFPFSTKNPFKLENLKELQVAQETGDMSMLLSLECPLLENFKLSIITLTPHRWTNSTVPVGGLLQVAQHFSPKLQRLNLSFMSGIVVNDLTPTEYYNALLKLELPHLKMLIMDGWTESLDILLCMPSLQYLDIASSRRFSHLQMLQQHKYGCAVLEDLENLDNLYESIIWRLMPFIMEIKLSSESKSRRRSHFTREGYEYFKG